jgi:nucleotidyltransferase-like protein
MENPAMADELTRMLTVEPDSRTPDRGQLWAIVLAGGEGQRLRPLTRLICGDDRPKQFAVLLDSPTRRNHS